MSTDAIIALHIMLDRLREAQLRQEMLIRELLRIVRTQAKTNTAPSESLLPQKWTIFLKPIATSAGQWAGGILAMAYVMKGGDLITGLSTLAKFLSGLG